MKPYFKIKKLDDRGVVPSKREEDSGYDFYMVIDNDFKVLEVGDIFLAPTKIACEFPKKFSLILFERGSTGSKGISRRCGVIDSNYRGEIFIALNNTSNKKIIFYKNENEIEKFLEKSNLLKEDVILYPQSKAIAQGIFVECFHLETMVVDDLENSDRGSGKLGSSGK